MERLYQAFNGPGPTSAQQLAVTSGTAIKTMLQLATPSTADLWIVEWGIIHDGHASCTSFSAELLSNLTGGATVTALAAADITAVNQAAVNLASNVVISSTTNGGYTSTNEQTLTAVDVYDSVYLTPTQADRYCKQYPLGREPHVAKSSWVRIRVTAAGNATNVRCWITWAE